MANYIHELPRSVKDATDLLDGLIREVINEFATVSMPASKARSSRYSVMFTSLHAITEQAESIMFLVRQHRNEAAALILRTMMETYTRLVYILLERGELNLAKLAYLDVLSQINDYKQLRIDFKKHDKHWTLEPKMYTDKLRGSIKARLGELNEIEIYYEEYLKRNLPKEYFGPDGEIDVASLKKSLTLGQIARTVDKEKMTLGENANARVNYSMVYAYLSKYVHASTFYLVKLRKQEDSGSIKINPVNEKDYEEDSVRSIYTTYALLSDTYIEVLTEMGMEVQNVKKKIEAVTSNFPIFGQSNRKG